MTSEFSEASLFAAASLFSLLFDFTSDCHTWELDAACTSSGRFPCTFFVLRFESCWLGALSILGRFDACELGAVEELATACETRCSVGFAFATILSSLVPSCILSDMVWWPLAELKLPMLNSWRRWFHPSRVKLPFVSISASWIWVSTYLIWMFGCKLILSRNQSRATLWVSGYVTHCWTSALGDHLDHRFITFKNVEHRTKVRRLHVSGNIDDIA